MTTQDEEKHGVDNIKDILNTHGNDVTEAIHLALEQKIKLPLLCLRASVDQ